MNRNPVTLQTILSDLLSEGARSSSPQSWLDLVKGPDVYLDIPSRKTPGWEAVGVRQVFQKERLIFPQVDVDELPEWVVSSERENYALVFVDGVFIPELSTCLDVVRVEQKKQLNELTDEQLQVWIAFLNNLPKHEVMARLAWCIQQSVCHCYVDQNDISSDIHIYQYSTNDKPFFLGQNWAFHVGSQNRIHLFEHGIVTASPDNRKATLLANRLFEVGLGSHLSHYVFSGADEDVEQFCQGHVVLSQDAGYEGGVFAAGKGVFRSQLVVSLNGSGARAVQYGVLAPHQSGQMDCQWLMDHESPGCESQQILRCVAADLSVAGFCGRVHVAKDAQKTDAGQMCKGLLLNDRAKITSKPELEIYADDVKCAHGATVGCLDAEALFYLQSRGLNEPAAKKVLITGFVESVIGDLSHKNARDLAKRVMRFFYENLAVRTAV